MKVSSGKECVQFVQVHELPLLQCATHDIIANLPANILEGLSND